MSRPHLFYFSHGPMGSSYAQEGLDALMGFASFNQPCQVLIQGDALLCLLRSGQSPLHKRFKSLPLFGVEALFALRNDLDALGLTPDDLSLSLSLLEERELAAFVTQHAQVFSF